MKPWVKEDYRSALTQSSPNYKNDYRSALETAIIICRVEIKWKFLYEKQGIQDKKDNSLMYVIILQNPELK